MTDFEGAQLALQGQRIALDKITVLAQALTIDRPLLNFNEAATPTFTKEQQEKIVELYYNALIAA